MKTPATLSLDELAEIADVAARKADKEARKAGVKVSGIERNNKLPGEKANPKKEISKPLLEVGKGRGVNE